MDYPPRSNLILNDNSIDITYEVFNEFSSWINGLSKNIFEKIKANQEKIRDLNLSVILTEINGRFILTIKGPNDDDKTDYLSGPSFTFERMSKEVWGFGISIEDENITLDTGEEITLDKQGFARYLPTLMFYLLNNKKISHADFDKFGLRIGIDTDASQGFWNSMGMKIGRYSVDNPRKRDTSSTGAYTGLEKEFSGISLDEWEKWVYEGSKSTDSVAAGTKGGRTKKICKKKNKKKSKRRKTSKKKKSKKK